MPRSDALQIQTPTMEEEFDADDEDFLQAALSVEVIACSGSSNSCDSPLLPLQPQTKRKSFELHAPSLNNNTKRLCEGQSQAVSLPLRDKLKSDINKSNNNGNVKIRDYDPLGLNKSLLNNQHFGRHESHESSYTFSSIHDSNRTDLNIPGSERRNVNTPNVKSNIQTKETAGFSHTTPVKISSDSLPAVKNSATKKFNFKSRTSPTVVSSNSNSSGVPTSSSYIVQTTTDDDLHNDPKINSASKNHLTGIRTSPEAFPSSNSPILFDSKFPSSGRSPMMDKRSSDSQTATVSVKSPDKKGGCSTFSKGLHSVQEQSPKSIESGINNLVKNNIQELFHPLRSRLFCGQSGIQHPVSKLQETAVSSSKRPETFVKHPGPGSSGNIFTVSQDDWDSDLDLSNLGSPTWKPKTDDTSEIIFRNPLLTGNKRSVENRIDYPAVSTLEVMKRPDSKSVHTVSVPVNNQSAVVSQVTTDACLSSSNSDKSLQGDTSGDQSCFKTPVTTRLRPAQSAYRSTASEFTQDTPNFFIKRSNSNSVSEAIQKSDGSFQMRRPMTTPSMTTSSTFNPTSIGASTPKSVVAPEKPLRRTSDGFLTSFAPETPIPRESLRSSIVKSHSLSGAAQTSNMTPQNTPSNIPAEHLPSETASCSRLSQSSSTGSNRRKRKFPGPAGVLPKLRPGLTLEAMNMYKPASPRIPLGQKQIVPDSQVPSSQNFEDRFSEGPWRAMTQELEPQAKRILQQYSVAEILKKACKKQLVRGKVPLVCVLLDQVNIQNTEASVTLRDPTGEMRGTIHRTVVHEYPGDLQAGTALVLRQVGVFSPSPRNHYLNITPSNLVRIYSRGGLSQGINTTTVAKLTEEDFKVPAPVPQTPNRSLNSSSPRLGTPGLDRSLAHTPQGFRSRLQSPGNRFSTGNIQCAPQPSMNHTSPCRPGFSMNHGLQRTPGGFQNNAGSIQQIRTNFSPRGFTPQGSIPRLSNPSSQGRPQLHNTGFNPNNASFHNAGPSSANGLISASHTITRNQSIIIPSKSVIPGQSSSTCPVTTHQVAAHVSNPTTVAPSVGGMISTSMDQTHTLEGLWQDDQLDDLLSDIGDDMLINL